MASVSLSSSLPGICGQVVTFRTCLRGGLSSQTAWFWPELTPSHIVLVAHSEVHSLWHIPKFIIWGTFRSRYHVAHSEVHSLWHIPRFIPCGTFRSSFLVAHSKVDTLWHIPKSIPCGTFRSSCLVQHYEVHSLWHIPKSILCGTFRSPYLVAHSEIHDLTDIQKQISIISKIQCSSHIASKFMDVLFGIYATTIPLLYHYYTTTIAENVLSAIVTHSHDLLMFPNTPTSSSLAFEMNTTDNVNVVFRKVCFQPDEQLLHSIVTVIVNSDAYHQSPLMDKSMGEYIRCIGIIICIINILMCDEWLSAVR